MLVSQSQIDRRSCPACRAEVVSEIWFILHRQERPKLWQRSAYLRTLTCPNGHSGPLRGPLLLFDPASPFVLYSPWDESNSAHVRAEGDHLMRMLWQSLPKEQKTTQFTVEMVPAELLPVLLEHPRLNLGDLAPGAPESEEALRICSDIRSGNASPHQLRAWIDDGRLHPALRAGIRFELASYLAREGLDDPSLTEKAIPEWRQVIRLYPRTSDPRRWAISNLELAFCYANRRAANPAANLREALRLLDTALEILTADRYPEDFALACSRKANLLLDMGTNADLVTRSVSVFESALSVYTKESYPEDWSLVLSNMATAYLSRGGYTGLDDLRQAINLLEQVLKVRTRHKEPESWAITQMNLGLAFSRLPASDPGNPRARAVEALRVAYSVFGELSETALQSTAAYNLGITLAHFADSATAEEACDRLEESLPWLVETDQVEQAEEAIDLLASAYMTLLRNGPEVVQGDRICRRAFAALNNQTGNHSAIQAIYHVGVWLLQHAENKPDRLDLSGAAFERVFGTLQATEYAELRAAALANFATVLLLQKRGSRELNSVRARDSFDEALRILRSLPATPEREEWIGLILKNRMHLDM
jgi:tetratricopeptide (TPR) repeat protein